MPNVLDLPALDFSRLITLPDDLIAYRLLFARATGSVASGLLLTILVQESPRRSAGDGWFRYGIREAGERLGMNRSEYSRALRALLECGAVTKATLGKPPLMYLRLNVARIAMLMLLDDASEATHDDDAEGPEEPLF